MKNISRIGLHCLLMMVIALSSLKSVAAEPCRFQVGFDFGISASFYQRYVTSEDYPLGDNVAVGAVMRHLSLLYNINKKFTAGIGVGLDGYTVAPNAVPLFGTFRYRPIQKRVLENFYCFTNLGYSLPFVDSGTFAAGWLFDLGIGWQKNFRKHFGLNVQLGYALKEFRTNYGYASNPYGWPDVASIKLPYKYSLVRNSIFLGIGIVI
ncbi:MAG: hypothetical protein NC311_16080 [Muribaculaceae bacterium]|nr:hypothetical protein [Muribaculaceae bacterium]